MREYKLKQFMISILICAVFAVSLAALYSCQSSAPSVDLIIKGGKIYTMDPDQPEVEALVSANGKIVFVGSNEEALKFATSETLVIDLAGGCAVPGLIDAHAHLMNLGRSLSRLNLVGTESKEQVKELASNFVTTGPWILGRGWDQNDWEIKEFPHWRDLEGVSDKPINLRRVDGHAAWVNKRALEISGVTRDTPDPEGGRIIHDADGEPSGVFVDAAMGLVSRHIPMATLEEHVQWARAALAECNKYGLVGIRDAGIDSMTIHAYEALAETNELPLRIWGMLDGSDTVLMRRFHATGPQDFAQGRLKVRAVKLYADGALGSRGAALLEPYTDEPGNSGLLQVSSDSLGAMVNAAINSGFQVCTHAIGDAGIRQTLDAYEKALQANPNARHRVEHAQVISPADIPRFAKLGVIAAMQPTHATSDMYWAEDRVGAERITGAYVWRTLLDSGARLAFGSDFPVESANPLWGIYAAVTRQDHQGWPEGGWRAEEAVTMTEAVRGFTLDACYASFEENERGSLEVGKQTDITILDLDIFSQPPIRLLNTSVTHTILDGKVVYRKEG